MDKIFDDFKIWIKNRDDEWKKQNVVIDEIVESTHAHQIHIKLHSAVGYGHIGLFESNDIYWVEFEAVARDFENFYKYFEFDKLPCFNDIERDYLYFMIRNEQE